NGSGNASLLAAGARSGNAMLPAAGARSGNAALPAAGARWSCDDSARVHEAHLLKLDSTKARTRLGWGPRWSLDETLEHTAEWYRGYYRGEDMGALSLKQIEQYMSPMNER